MRRYPNATLEEILSLSDAFAGPSRPRPHTYAEAARATPSPPPTRSVTPVSSRASSRAGAQMAATTKRQQGKRRRIRAPAGASRRIYIRFPNPPPAEMRVGPLTIVSTVNAALATQPDEHMCMRATSADWTPSGQLYIQFLSEIPSAAAFDGIIREIATINNWGGNQNTAVAPTVERHIYTSQLCFRAVECVDGDGNLLDPQQVAVDAFRNAPQWLDAPVRRVSFMPPRNGASTTTLVVEIADTSSRARQRALAGTQVPFYNGVRTAQVLENRRQVPQCPQCLRWGHVRSLCRANSATCEICGEAHEARHHRALASCCRGSTAPACDHQPQCINCGQTHRATSRECPYYAHRNDFGWHQAHPAQPRRNRTTRTTNTNAAATAGADAAAPTMANPTNAAATMPAAPPHVQTAPTGGPSVRFASNVVYHMLDADEPSRQQRKRARTANSNKGGGDGPRGDSHGHPGASSGAGTGGGR